MVNGGVPGGEHEPDTHGVQVRPLDQLRHPDGRARDADCAHAPGGAADHHLRWLHRLHRLPHPRHHDISVISWPQSECFLYFFLEGGTDLRVFAVGPNNHPQEPVLLPPDCRDPVPRRHRTD